MAANCGPLWLRFVIVVHIVLLTVSQSSLLSHLWRCTKLYTMRGLDTNVSFLVQHEAMPSGTLMDKPPRQPYFFTGQLKKSRLPRSGLGRPKGSLDKLRGDAKTQLIEVFRQCGSLEGAVKWASSNPDLFYPLYFKALVPKPTIEQSVDGQTSVHVHFLVTDTSASTTTKQIPTNNVDPRVIDHAKDT